MKPPLVSVFVVLTLCLPQIKYSDALRGAFDPSDNIVESGESSKDSGKSPVDTSGRQLLLHHQHGMMSYYKTNTMTSMKWSKKKGMYGEMMMSAYSTKKGMRNVYKMMTMKGGFMRPMYRPPSTITPPPTSAPTGPPSTSEGHGV